MNGALTRSQLIRPNGSQPESIERDMRDTFDYGMLRMPAVMVLDNLDVLTPKVSEHTQDGEYTNRFVFDRPFAARRRQH